MLPVLVQPCFLSHTYKCWHSPPLSAYIITTVGPHFESECSQWSEPWLSCDDWGSGRPIHKQFTMKTTVIILEMNFILGDISRACSIGWWVPVQCHRRLVCIYSSSQILNCVWSQSCSMWISKTCTWIHKPYHKIWPLYVANLNWCKPFHPCTELRCKHLEQQGLRTKGVAWDKKGPMIKPGSQVE